MSRSGLESNGRAEVTSPGRSSLAAVPSVVDALLARSAAGARQAILLAMDGVGAASCTSHWRPDELITLESTVPSTTAVAWLTSTTGLQPRDHLVPGTVFRAPRTNRLVHAIAGGDVPWMISRLPTIFTTLADRGVPSFACLGALTSFPGSWRAALIRGATPIPSSRCPSLAGDPLRAASAAIDDVDDVRVALRGRSCLIWAYVDLDTALHRRGYDKRWLTALEVLNQAAERWAGPTCVVLAVSDHGMTPVLQDAALAAAWRELEASSLCRMPAGGAGRVRWLHATPGSEARLAEEARAVLDGVADVYATGTETSPFDPSPRLQARLGEVIAVARDPRFPTPEIHAFEHGGVTDDELDVPFARWGGADDATLAAALIPGATSRRDTSPT